MRHVILALLSWVVAANPAFSQNLDEDFDRLDGFGRSGKKVDVIEWEGNLEIHVYPGGSTEGLALKLDDRSRSKKVMVIGYRFKNRPSEQLIRRAIVSIPLEQGFKVYRDPSAGREYDKFVITNQRASASWVAFRPEPAPTQLYPDGHPALAEGSKQRKTESVRTPASRPHITGGIDEDSGAIRSKSW